ncbi:MAG: hypothetical protein KF861_04235 [Planctomycetaceae bacterium]|nr:hypothetical protein [Planctomycetaceae bacterium]
MRPLVRTLKHVTLAVALIVAGLCVTEVGLRLHHLQGMLKGGLAAPACGLSRPCSITYQQLPFGYRGTHRSRETGTEIEFWTNSLGLRGPEVSVPKPAGHYRVVCLGDDATLAPDIADDATFCRMLETILQPGFDGPVEVVNAGMPGHCPLLNLAWARARLMGLQPDLVILCCDVSDVEDDRRCRPLAKFDSSGNLLCVENPSAKERPKDWVSAVEGEFLLARLVGENLGKQIVPDAVGGSVSDSLSPSAGIAENAAPDAALVQQTWEPLAAIQSFCRQTSAELVVAVVPSAATVRSASAMEAAGAPDRVGELLLHLVDRANRERIPMLDASPEFAHHEERSRLFLQSSGALSTLGHRLFADILGQALLAREHPQSARQAVPVSDERPADPVGPVPLRSLERRPRNDQPAGHPLRNSPGDGHRSPLASPEPFDDFE